MGTDAARRAMDSFGLRRDPTKPVTQAEVENEILRLCEKLERHTDALAGRARLAAEAEANHKARRASVYLQSESGTDGKRAAEADAQCHDLYMQRKITEALYESEKQACRSTEHQLDALRTIAANIRAQT